MRVSKTVKEYIEKQVRAKFPKTEEELQYEKVNHIVNAASNEYHELMKQAKQEIVEKLVKKYDLTSDMVEEKTSYSYSPFGTWKTKAREQANKAEKERNTAINETIENIIVTLELGGTKADLEKMLAEI
jgi:hypothetical protein